MFLNRGQLLQKIQDEGLISGYIDLDTQLQPNGFDLTAGEIHRYQGKGKLDFSNSEREIPDTRPVKPEKKSSGDGYGWWTLDPGVYKVIMNERVDIPENVVGFAFPRSSLLRMGVTVDNAVWDSGFTGTGAFMMTVQNQEGVEIKQNARVNQILFAEIEGTEGYRGRYHEE